MFTVNWLNTMWLASMKANLWVFKEFNGKLKKGGEKTIK
jgi:hypothetical protein